MCSLPMHNATLAITRGGNMKLGIDQTCLNKNVSFYLVLFGKQKINFVSLTVYPTDMFKVGAIWKFCLHPLVSL